ERGEKLEDQIAVRRVEFDEIEPGALRPCRCLRKMPDDLPDLVLAERTRYLPALVVRDSRCGDHRPRVLVMVQRSAAFPGPPAGRLASGMPQLRAEHGA